MDGWMDDGWMDGWMDEWMNEMMNEWMSDWANQVYFQVEKTKKRSQYTIINISIYTIHIEMEEDRSAVFINHYPQLYQYLC